MMMMTTTTELKSLIWVFKKMFFFIYLFFLQYPYCAANCLQQVPQVAGVYIRGSSLGTYRYDVCHCHCSVQAPASPAYYRGSGKWHYSRVLCFIIVITTLCINCVIVTTVQVRTSPVHHGVHCRESGKLFQSTLLFVIVIMTVCIKWVNVMTVQIHATLFCHGVCHGEGDSNITPCSVIVFLLLWLHVLMCC